MVVVGGMLCVCVCTCVCVVCVWCVAVEIFLDIYIYIYTREIIIFALGVPGEPRSGARWPPP